MSDPSDTLDAFLDGPSQRALTRVVHRLLARSRLVTLVLGNGEAAERLVSALAREFPDRRAHVALIELDPVRLTMDPQTPTPALFDVMDATPDALLRSLLRQDPDAIALTRLEAADPALLMNTAFTGHQLLLGSGAASADAVIGTLCAGTEGLDGHLRGIVELVCELDSRGRLRRVLRGDGTGQLVGAAWIEGEHVVVDPSLAIEAPRRAVSEVAWAPPLESRPAPSRAPRRAFLPITQHDAEPLAARPAPACSLLGTRWLHRPRGSSWPTCAECGAPLVSIVQLDLDSLPAPLARQRGVAQLFLCTRGGCALVDERSAGVLAEILEPDAVELVEAPASLEVEVVAPGIITGWRGVDEDPHEEDLARLGLDASSDAGPLRCDKLGGWPAWEQGLDWPLDDAGQPLELLFQLAEGGVRVARETADRGDEPIVERALDPNLPCHFPSVLTADAVAFLFWQPGTRRIAFRWQTG